MSESDATPVWKDDKKDENETSRRSAYLAVVFQSQQKAVKNALEMRSGRTVFQCELEEVFLREVNMLLRPSFQIEREELLKLVDDMSKKPKDKPLIKRRKSLQGRFYRRAQEKKKFSVVGDKQTIVHATKDESRKKKTEEAEKPLLLPALSIMGNYSVLASQLATDAITRLLAAEFDILALRLAEELEVFSTSDIISEEQLRPFIRAVIRAAIAWVMKWFNKDIGILDECYASGGSNIMRLSGNLDWAVLINADKLRTENIRFVVEAKRDKKAFNKTSSKFQLLAELTVVAEAIADRRSKKNSVRGVLTNFFSWTFMQLDVDGSTNVADTFDLLPNMEVGDVGGRELLKRVLSSPETLKNVFDKLCGQILIAVESGPVAYNSEKAEEASDSSSDKSPSPPLDRQFDQKRKPKGSFEDGRDVEAKMARLQLNAPTAHYGDNAHSCDHGQLGRNTLEVVDENPTGGAFGNVFQCRTTCCKELVAVKVFSDADVASYEAHNMGQIRDHGSRLTGNDSPGYSGVVHLLCLSPINWSENSQAILMEWWDGPNLADFLRQKESLIQLSFVRSITKQLLSGLDFLHAACGIIHADLKPDNILVKMTAWADVECKICDFGNALQTSSARIHQQIQSQKYRALEVVIDAGFGPLADIWSLGCVVYLAATGCGLFRRSDTPDGHLAQMIETLGDIPVEVLCEGNLSWNYFEEQGCQLKNVSSLWPLSLLERLTNVLGNGTETRDFARFLRKFLLYDQIERPTAAQLLADPWICRPPVTHENSSPLVHSNRQDSQSESKEADTQTICETTSFRVYESSDDPTTDECTVIAQHITQTSDIDSDVGRLILSFISPYKALPEMISILRNHMNDYPSQINCLRLIDWYGDDQLMSLNPRLKRQLIDVLLTGVQHYTNNSPIAEMFCNLLIKVDVYWSDVDLFLGRLDSLMAISCGENSIHTGAGQSASVLLSKIACQSGFDEKNQEKILKLFLSSGGTQLMLQSYKNFNNVPFLLTCMRWITLRLTAEATSDEQLRRALMTTENFKPLWDLWEKTDDDVLAGAFAHLLQWKPDWPDFMTAAYAAFLAEKSAESCS